MTETTFYRMKLVSLTTVAIVAVVFFLIAAGCTQPAGTASNTTGSPAGQSAAPLTQLRIGYQPSTHQMAEITAMNKGWWQQDLAPLGVTNVSDKVFPTGAPEMQAMLAGDLDVAYVRDWSLALDLRLLLRTPLQLLRQRGSTV